MPPLVGQHEAHSPLDGRVLFVGYAAFGGAFDVLDVLVQSTTRYLQGWSLPEAAPFGNFGLGDCEVKSIGVGVDGDVIAILDQGDWATLLGFGSYVPDDKSMRATAEPTVGDQGDIAAQACAHDCRSWGEHFRHAWSAFGSFVTNDNDIPFADPLFFEGQQHGFFTVKALRWTGEGEPFFAGDLGNGTIGCKIAAEDLNMSGLLDGILNRLDNFLTSFAEERSPQDFQRAFYR